MSLTELGSHFFVGARLPGVYNKQDGKHRYPAKSEQFKKIKGRLIRKDKASEYFEVVFEKCYCDRDRRITDWPLEISKMNNDDTVSILKFLIR